MAYRGHGGSQILAQRDSLALWRLTPDLKRYLKLTNVSPDISRQYGKVNFEQIFLLALSEDHNLQERIWNNRPLKSGNRYR
ncbi:MAG TPA: hypothetical protein VFI43_09690 [Nitrosospira sp.]|nr:hypothetical protein [Nitrosospira sp.]